MAAGVVCLYVAALGGRGGLPVNMPPLQFLTGSETRCDTAGLHRAGNAGNTITRGSFSHPSPSGRTGFVYTGFVLLYFSSAFAEQREGKSQGIHLQLDPNTPPDSKQQKILLWMQTLLLNRLPGEKTLQFGSWGIECTPAESRAAGSLATGFIAGRTLLRWGLM